MIDKTNEQNFYNQIIKDKLNLKTNYNKFKKVQPKFITNDQFKKDAYSNKYLNNSLDDYSKDKLKPLILEKNNNSNNFFNSDSNIILNKNKNDKNLKLLRIEKNINTGKYEWIFH